MIDLVKFAQGITDLMWEEGEYGHCDLDNDAVQDLAEECGIVFFRAPTDAELADPLWFGHDMGITAGDKAVGELTEEFKALFADKAA